MKFTFRGKKISGILTVVPANEKFFVEEMRNFNFPEARSLKLAEVMGYKKRRQVNPGVCVSDLAVLGLQNLFSRGLLKPEEVDEVLLVGGQTRMPAIQKMIEQLTGKKPRISKTPELMVALGAGEYAHILSLGKKRFHQNALVNVIALPLGIRYNWHPSGKTYSRLQIENKPRIDIGIAIRLGRSHDDIHYHYIDKYRQPTP